MDTLFLSFAIAIIIATVLGILLKVLKQPPLVGYILAGILLGTFLFPQLNVNANITSLNLFSQMDVASKAKGDLKTVSIQLQEYANVFSSIKKA